MLANVVSVAWFVLTPWVVLKMATRRKLMPVTFSSFTVFSPPWRMSRRAKRA